MLPVYDKFNKLSLNEDLSFKLNWCKDIERIDRLSNESYEYFVENYLILNKPCIFASHLTDNWKSRQKWIKPDGKPKLDYLVQEFGSSLVPVVICDDQEDNCCKRKELLFKTYIDSYFKSSESIPDRKYYLKDWHFTRAFPDYEAYNTPICFCDDWLNEFCENEDDDFKFVYMGPKGTWTPLHADVYGSYSWSANICGKKRWILFPPGEEKLLHASSKKLPFMLNECDIKNLTGISFFDIIQNPGEIIFVPSGWHHQVWNLEDTISINHNWFNRYNIQFIWYCLCKASSDVEEELSDLKQFDDWQDQHQILLKAHHGMNSFDFFRILKTIYESRTIFPSQKGLSSYRSSDIQAVKSVCEKMLKYSLPIELSNNIKLLLDKI